MLSKDFQVFKILIPDGTMCNTLLFRSPSSASTFDARLRVSVFAMKHFAFQLLVGAEDL